MQGGIGRYRDGTHRQRRDHFEVPVVGEPGASREAGDPQRLVERAADGQRVYGQGDVSAAQILHTEHSGRRPAFRQRSREGHGLPGHAEPAQREAGVELRCVRPQLLLRQPGPTACRRVHGMVDPGREGVVRQGGRQARPTCGVGAMTLRQPLGDLVPGGVVQPQGRQGLPALLCEGVEAVAVHGVGQSAQFGEDGVVRGQLGAVRLAYEQRQPGGVHALEAVLGERQQQGVVGVRRHTQPDAVRAVGERAPGAQTDDVLAEQGAEDTGEQLGSGSHGRCGGHGWTSQCRAARNSADTRSTVG